MARTMRAAVAEQLGMPFSIREIPVGDPGASEVLINIRASGVCPTDTSISTGGWLMKRPSFPYVPGHEGCGVVAAVGKDVKGIKEGDRVGAVWLSSTCQTCDFCRGGRENLCEKQISNGYTKNGTHAEFCIVSADYVFQLPPGDFVEQTPIMCAGVTSYKAVKELGAKAGDVIVVVGAGATGLLAIQYAIAEGLSVIAVDVDESKLQLALDLGALYAFNASQFPASKVIRETGGVGGVIVTAPSAKAFEQSMRMLRRGGVCVLVGVATEALQISAFSCVINELTVKGTVSGTRSDVVEALERVRDGKIKTITETLPLEKVNDAVELVQQQRAKGRVVLTI